ncbi:SRPBCC family protein [Leifsonia shinshuensis]|uniref:SRPBCC family protein n=1 Tax=Leifsonia shinshuensis TaxID=150026 RepID=UPI001F5120C0|nr:SRPBCC family protein [Leifsonia shinshuensis]MCI0159156.1 SRPBCC family protein [Leifsonia shinshuensis]
MSFTLDLDLQADSGTVFAFVADFANTPRWYSAVQRVERISGSGGVGTRYAVHRRLPTGPVVNTVEVSSRDDGREIEFVSVDGPTPFRYRYRIHPAGQGSRLQLDGSISAEGLPGPARLLGPLAERLFRNGMRDNLGTLQRIVEGR